MNDKLPDDKYEARFKAMKYDLPKVSLEDVRQKLIALTSDTELVELTVKDFDRVTHRSPEEQAALMRSLRRLLESLHAEDAEESV